MLLERKKFRPESASDAFLQAKRGSESAHMGV